MVFHSSCNCYLIKKKPPTFFEEVTRLILATANELLTRQDLLCSLLEKKDQEISQYKLEGVTLCRRNVETQVFNKSDFVSNRHSRDSNSAEEIIKVLGVVNLFKRDIAPCEDESACIKQDKQELNQVSAPDSRNSGAASNAADSTQDVKPKLEASVLKVPKKKRPKLNL